MMITLNKTSNSITGSVNNEQFGIPFSQERWNEMVKLQEAAENASTIEELKSIIADFLPLTVITDKEYVESKCPNILVSNRGTFHLNVDGHPSRIAMPKQLVDNILESLDADISADPLIKLWTRWLRNPILRGYSDEEASNFSERFFTYINAVYVSPEKVSECIEDGFTEERAQELSTVNQVQVTKEGLLATYKVSQEIMTKFDTESGEQVSRYKYEYDENTGIKKRVEADIENEDRLFQPVMMGTSGDAFFCEGDNGFVDSGHFIRVGCVHRLPSWSYVNTDNHRSCVKGLHLGGLNYIRGYQRDTTATHNCLVDPTHIGAIPCASHEGDGAIRVLQYFVLDEFSGTNGSLYHSSDYAAKTDTEWGIERAEILKEFGELQEEADAEKQEILNI
jgi:hypothetical protein